jgi:CRISPR-associated protein Cmr1
MPSITFDLETVTPLFLAGADRTTAELRPPAFRGALRYWFRAVASSITSFDEVKKWENKVFGNTDVGGSVIIRIQAQKGVSRCILTRDNDFPGLVYLFFSTYGDKTQNPRGCFPPGSHFKLILQTRLNREGDIKCLQLAIGAMWMLINLGAIGFRSNRGAGNLKVRKEPENNNSHLKFVIQSSNTEELASEISNGIKSIKDIYTNILSSISLSLTPLTKFEIVDCQTSSLYLWQSPNLEDNNYWDNSLDAFGNIFRNFRLRYNQAASDDYREIKDWLRTNGKTTITTIKRAAFGLPIQFRFKSLPGKQAYILGTGGINRSSSPLHIRVIKLSNQTLTILIIHFKTQLLPHNQKLLLKSKQGTPSVRVSVLNQDIIQQEFIPALGNLTSVKIP